MLKLTLSVGLVLVLSVFPLDIGTTDASPPAAASTFSVDPVHSALVFEIRYANLSTFYGRFNEFSGSFSVDEDDLSKSSFNLEVKAESIDSGNKQRDRHLASPDFISAKQYSKISFVSKSVKVVKGRELEVTGDLTLRGVTKSIVAKVRYGGQAEDRRGGTRAGFDGTIKFSRKAFGVTFGEGMLGDDVTVRMGLTGLKK